MQHSSSERDFSAYNGAQRGRAVRPLARRAIQVAGPQPEGSARRAIDLGSGVGVETRFLAEHGYTIDSYDMDPSVSASMADLAAELPVHHTTADLAEITSLPDADLVLACMSLPFVRHEAFDGLWRSIRRALRPGGILAVDLFGDRDDWAGTDGAFLTRADIEALLVGLEVITLTEVERDGASFRGPKHWHTYEVIARRL